MLQVWIKSTLFLLISLIYKAVYLAIAEKFDLLPNKISHEPPNIIFLYKFYW